MTYQKLIPAIIAGLLPFAGLPVLAQQGVPGGHFIENWDIDGDGFVTPEEAESKRVDLFVMFDMDSDNSLSGEEYVLFDETRHADMDLNAGGVVKGPMRSVEEGLTLKFNDVDGDGQVSMDEFAGRTSVWFPMLDSSGDGLVGPEDFAPRG